MLDKTQRFFQRLFQRVVTESPPDEPNQLAAYQFAAYRLAAGALPGEGSVGCVFEEGWIREITGEKLPSRPLSEKETFWSVCSRDISIEMLVDRSGDLPPLVSTLSIRFEPELGLGTLLAGRETLTIVELSDLVRTRFTGLLDTLGVRQNDLSQFDADSLERLRAKYSLLLSTGGLRCVGLGPFTEREPVPVESQRDETELGDAAESEIDEAIQNVRTESDWRDLVSHLRRDGLPEDAHTQETFADLGRALLQQHMTSQEAAATIRHMVESVAKTNGIERPSDLSYWNGLALRLRLDATEEYEGTPNESPVRAPKTDVAVTKSRRPTRSLFTRRITFDARLRIFLLQKIDTVQKYLESKRATVQEISIVVALRELAQKLEWAKDLATTIPELDVQTKDLRPDRTQFARFIQEMNQTVTVMEYLEAEIRSDQYGHHIESVQEALATVETLISSLQKRHQTRF